jgi:hypothetical protein
MFGTFSRILLRFIPTSELEHQRRVHVHGNTRYYNIPLKTCTRKIFCENFYEQLFDARQQYNNCTRARTPRSRDCSTLGIMFAEEDDDGRRFDRQGREGCRQWDTRIIANSYYGPIDVCVCTPAECARTFLIEWRT